MRAELSYSGGYGGEAPETQLGRVGGKKNATNSLKKA